MERSKFELPKEEEMAMDVFEADCLVLRDRLLALPKEKMEKFKELLITALKEKLPAGNPHIIFRSWIDEFLENPSLETAKPLVYLSPGKYSDIFPEFSDKVEELLTKTEI